MHSQESIAIFIRDGAILGAVGPFWDAEAAQAWLKDGNDPEATGSVMPIDKPTRAGRRRREIRKDDDAKEA